PGALRVQRPALLRAPIDRLVPTHPRFASRPAVSSLGAAEEPWLLDRPASPYHRLVRPARAAAGLQPENAHQSREWETGAALVSAGLGVALIPRLARLPDGFDVVRVPLRGDPVPSRKILTGIRSGSGGQPIIAAALAALGEVS